MNPLRLFRDVFAALHGGSDPRHLAAGFALGAALGLVPKGNLMAALIVLLFFVFRVNKGLAFLSAAFFTPFAYAIDAPAHKLGLALLKAGALRGLWTALYDMPIVPLTRFNNTVVLGNLVLAIVLYYPLYRLGLWMVASYATTLGPKVEKLRVVQALKGAYWFRTYREWSS